MEQPAFINVVDNFLKPLECPTSRVVDLTKQLTESLGQELETNARGWFIPTHVNEVAFRNSLHGVDAGLYLVVTISCVHGTNPSLNVGLFSPEKAPNGVVAWGVVQERRWKFPATEQWKDNAAALFEWIGVRMAEVVQKAANARPDLHYWFSRPLITAVTSDFPMEQDCVSRATFTWMGKLLDSDEKLDLGEKVHEGYYRQAQHSGLPDIEIRCICSSATAAHLKLVANSTPNKPRNEPDYDEKSPAMYLEFTGASSFRAVTAASVPSCGYAECLLQAELHLGHFADIFHELGFITRWDSEVATREPSGDVVIETIRVIFMDYLQSVAGLSWDIIPAVLRTPYGLDETQLVDFLVNAGDLREPDWPADFQWTEHIAYIFEQCYHLVMARAERIITAFVMAILGCTGNIAYDAAKLEQEMGRLSMHDNSGAAGQSHHPTTTTDAASSRALLISSTTCFIFPWHDIFIDRQRRWMPPLTIDLVEDYRHRDLQRGAAMLAAMLSTSP